MATLHPRGYSPRRGLPALVRAHAWWQELCSGESRSIKHIADREGSDERYVARNLKLAFLAPDITKAIIEGNQPAGLTADALIKMSDLSCRWEQQRRCLGYASIRTRGVCMGNPTASSGARIRPGQMNGIGNALGCQKMENASIAERVEESDLRIFRASENKKPIKKQVAFLTTCFGQ